MRFLTLLLIIAAFACKNNPSDSNASGGSGDTTAAKVPFAYTFTDTILVSLGPTDFAAVTKAKMNMPILDIRSPEDYNKGHIWRAENLPFSDPNFFQRIASFGRHQDYAIYCQTGDISFKVAEEMKKLGFMRIYHLQKGLIHWGDSGQALQIKHD